MAETVESLHFEIGANAQPFLDMLNKLSEGLNAMVSQAESAGISLDKMADGVSSSSATGAAGLRQVAESAKEAKSEVSAVGTQGGKELARGINTGAKQAQQALQQLDSASKRIFSAIKGYIAPLIAAAGFKSVFSGFINEGNELAKVSERVRMNAQEIDAWRKANVAAGGSSEAFTRAMEDFTKRTGLSGEQFVKMGQRLNGLQGRHAEYALKYLGLTRESAAVFLKSNKEMGELVTRYREFALTPKDVENARKFKITWESSIITLKSIGYSIARMIMPYVQKAIDLFGQAAEFFHKHAQFIKIALGLISGAALIAFGPKSALMMGSKLLGLLLSPIGAVTAAILALAIGIDDLVTFAQGGNSVFEDMLKSMGVAPETIEELRSSLKELGKRFDDLMIALKPVGEALMKVFGSALKVAIEVIVGVVGGLAVGLTKLLDIGDKLKTNLVDAFETIKKTIQDIKDWCEEKIDALMKYFDSIKPPAWIKSVSDTISGWFGKKTPEAKAENPQSSPAPQVIPPKVQTVAGSSDLSAKAAGAGNKTNNINNSVKNEIQMTFNGPADVEAVRQATAEGLSKGNASLTDILNNSATGVVSP